MDNVNLLTTTDTEGGLPAAPCLRFNKEGILLAVSTSENGIKFLTNTDGVRLLRSMENRPFDASNVASFAIVKPPSMGSFGPPNTSVGASIADRVAPLATGVAMKGENRNLADIKPRTANEPMDKSRLWKLTEINEPSQCRCLSLPDGLTAMRVSRLIYTNSGYAILALAAKTVQMTQKRVKPYWKGKCQYCSIAMATSKRNIVDI